MNFIHEDNNEKGSFFLKENGEKVAKIEYDKISESKINVHHTWTDESQRGKGIAGKLVKTLAEWAVKNDLEIEAECPYAAKVLERNPDWLKK